MLLHITEKVKYTWTQKQTCMINNMQSVCSLRKTRTLDDHPAWKQQDRIHLFFFRQWLSCLQLIRTAWKFWAMWNKRQVLSILTVLINNCHLPLIPVKWYSGIQKFHFFLLGKYGTSRLVSLSFLEISANFTILHALSNSPITAISTFYARENF